VRYACIRQHQDAYAVRLMCRVLRVTPAGYYAWRHRPPSRHARRDRQLLVAIRAIHRRSRGTYGSPRIRAELRAQGQACSAKRVARLMRQDGLAARRRRASRVTTQSRHDHPVAPNTLARAFSVAAVAARGGLDRVWASDITYLATHEGWLYLAVVLDLASRRVIGWAMRSTLERGLTLDALRMALAHRHPGAGVLHHSDRGSQYACGDYQALLQAAGMACSMSRVGDCWDNAVAESFFATLKTELADHADWATREAARTAVFAYIEIWYNRERRHSSLGYQSPLQYEQNWKSPHVEKTVVTQQEAA
jgi:putative transposase